jgi:hypothetical protein
MHSMHPARLDAVARARVTELHQMTAPLLGAGLPLPRWMAIRQTTGRLLTRLGLRLTVAPYLPSPAAR